MTAGPPTAGPLLACAQAPYTRSVAAESPEYRLLVIPPDAAGVWVAVCLDPYLVAQGADIDELAHAFATLWTAQVEADRAAGRVPFSRLGPAPAEYHARWDRAAEFFGARGATEWPVRVAVEPASPEPARAPRWHWRLDATAA